MLVTFECWCNFGGCHSGDSEIEMELTKEEFERLREAEASGVDFCDCEAVADIYERAWTLAEEDATENLSDADMLEDDEEAGDLYDIGVNYPDFEEYDEYED